MGVSGAIDRPSARGSLARGNGECNGLRALGKVVGINSEGQRQIAAADGRAANRNRGGKRRRDGIVIPASFGRRVRLRANTNIKIESGRRKRSHGPDSDGMRHAPAPRLRDHRAVGGKMYAPAWRRGRLGDGKIVGLAGGNATPPRRKRRSLRQREDDIVRLGVGVDANVNRNLDAVSVSGGNGNISHVDIVGFVEGNRFDIARRGKHKRKSVRRCIVAERNVEVYHAFALNDRGGTGIVRVEGGCVVVGGNHNIGAVRRGINLPVRRGEARARSNAEHDGFFCLWEGIVANEARGNQRCPSVGDSCGRGDHLGAVGDTDIPILVSGNNPHH